MILSDPINTNGYKITFFIYILCLNLNFIIIMKIFKLIYINGSSKKIQQGNIKKSIFVAISCFKRWLFTIFIFTFYFVNSQ